MPSQCTQVIEFKSFDQPSVCSLLCHILLHSPPASNRFDSRIQWPYTYSNNTVLLIVIVKELVIYCFISLIHNLCNHKLSVKLHSEFFKIYLLKCFNYEYSGHLDHVVWHLTSHDIFWLHLFDQTHILNSNAPKVPQASLLTGIDITNTTGCSNQNLWGYWLRER